MIIIPNTSTNTRIDINKFLKRRFLRIILILSISPIPYLFIHEISHIITGLIFGIKVESYNFKVTTLFVLHFQETSSQILDLFILVSGSFGVMIIGFVMLLLGMKKKSSLFYIFGMCSFYQEVFYMGLSCLINLGDWASVFSIFGFEYRLLFIFGILFIIFYFFLILLTIKGVLKFESKKIKIV